MALTQLQSTDTGADSLTILNAAIAKADYANRPFLVVGTDSSSDYVCDGTADEVQINAALTALGATGGMVFIKAGTYNLADSITIPSVDGIKLSGAGMGATILEMGTASAFNGINKLGTTLTNYLTIENMSIDGNKPNTTVVGGTSAIYLGRVNHLRIDNVSAYACRGDTIDLAGCQDFKITNTRVYGSNYMGFWVGDYTTTHSLRGYFENCEASYMVWEGWIIADNCNNMQFSNCKAMSNGTAGFYLGPDTSYCNFSNCLSSSNTQSGWDMGDRSSYNTCSSCHAISNTLQGFATAGAGNTFSSCVAFGNGTNGFYISGVGAGEAANNTIVGCRAVSNVGYGVVEDNLGADPNRTLVVGCNLLNNGGTYSFLGAQSSQANNILA